MAIPFTTITFSYSPPSGAIATGSVTATLTTPILDLSDKIVVPAGVYTGIVNAAGQGSLLVPQSDYAGFSTVPTYLITQNVAGAGVPFWTQVPSTLGPFVDITQLAPSAAPVVSTSPQLGVAQTWTAKQTFSGGLAVPSFTDLWSTGLVDSTPWRPEDNGLLAATGTLDAADSQIAPISKGFQYMSKLWIRKPITASTLWYLTTGSAAAGASSGTFVGIISNSGTVLAQSADCAVALTAVGAVSVPLTASLALNPATTPFVWVALVTNFATTQPSIRSLAAPSSSIFNLGLTAANFRSAQQGAGGITSLISFTPSTNASYSGHLWAGVS